VICPDDRGFSKGNPEKEKKFGKSGERQARFLDVDNAGLMSRSGSGKC